MADGDIAAKTKTTFFDNCCFSHEFPKKCKRNKYEMQNTNYR